MNESSRLRVFLVEDNPMISDRLVESLTATGRIDVVGRAETEHDAVEALGSTPWDALLLDLQLRNGTGFGVLRAVGKSRPEGAKILVLTNYAIPMLRERSLAMGADAFLDKAHEYDRAVDLLVDLAQARPAA
ncbi:MAG: response regulator transcription factor [Burkholderiales bacterium]|nr:response regulator transcription factor [Burkholderiales bacterium]